jgi:hypothetical protein
MYKGYDTAQICLNGHVINSMATAYSNHNKKFCDECGAATITACPSCSANIKGDYHSEVVSFAEFLTPKFCDNCGSQYPWTKTQLQVARELIELADELNQDQKDDLKINLEELVKESPKVPVAQIKVKKLLSKVDKDISKGIHEALAEIISETIQENIWKQ